jgi:Domain of unknown function (DUF4062)
MIQRIYQVFISSTFEDLKNERKEIQETLIKNNCLPRGMELFNSSDKSQWDIITDVIDDCDYFVLIISGKYGSIDKSIGLSHTRKEFEYAKKRRLPIIAFIRNNIDNLPASKVERDSKKIKMLSEFIEVVKQNRHVNFWRDKRDLALKLYASIEQVKSERPGIGYFKSNEIPTRFFDKEITTTINISGNWVSEWEEPLKDIHSKIISSEHIKFIQKGNLTIGHSKVMEKNPRKFRHEGWIFHNVYFGEFFATSRRKGATNGRGNCLLEINENCDSMEGTCSWFDIHTKQITTSNYRLKLKNNS